MMSLEDVDEANNFYPVQLQEMIIKTEAVRDEFDDDDDSLLSSKLKYENGEYYSSCSQSDVEITLSPCPIKIKPEDSGGDVHQVQVEINEDFKEEMDIQEHKPGWQLMASNVGMVKDDELTQCDFAAIYTCSECRYESEIKSDLVQHYKLKHLRRAQELYRCEECSFATRITGVMTQHYKYTHTKEADEDDDVYKCAKCSFETKDKVYLTGHYNYKHPNSIKDEEILYNCEACSYTTRYQSELTYHHKHKHSKEIYKCQECSYTAKQKGTLTQHYKHKHSKDAEVHRCGECSFESKYKHSLNHHYKRKHSKKARRVKV